MKTQIETEWHKFMDIFVVEDTEYHVEATVFTETTWRGTAATCEGWSSLPECLPPNPHYEKLEAKVLQEIEERYE